MTSVLMYHDVVALDARDDAGFAGAQAAAYKIDPDAFEAHLDAIAAAGISVGLPGAPADAVITFDDGGALSLSAAVALERRGWRGCFFVVTERLDSRGFATADDVRELVRRGHAVGSHSHTHPSGFSNLDAEAIDDEWRISAERLGDLLGSRPHLAATPGGDWSQGVAASAAANGYSTLFTSDPTTRVRSVGGVEVVGRYTIWRGTSPDRAAAYAAGSPAVRIGTWIGWRGRAAARRLGGASYRAAARRRAKRREKGASLS